MNRPLWSAWLTVMVAAAAVIGAPNLRGQQQSPRDTRTSTAPADGTSAISGIVLTTEREPQPIRRATVTLAGDGLTRTTDSDDNGRFVFDDLPAGRFTLVAGRPGYVRMSYGALRYDRAGTPIALAVGQRVTDIHIVLPKGAVISGAVRDEKGQASRDVTVRLHQFRQQGAERMLVTPPIAAAGGLIMAQTDDLGSYRLYGLPPGAYLISATPRNGVASSSQRATGAAGPRTYVPLFYPGTPALSEAALITVAAGEERANVDVLMQLVPTASIAGRVLTAAGSPRGVAVRLLSRSALSQPAYAFSIGVTVADDGRFNFSAVAPGDYIVTATVPGVRPGITNGAIPAAFWGETDVSVNGADLRDVVVMLQSAPSLRGRVMFEGAPIPTDISTRLRLALAPLDSAAPASHFVAEVTPTGQFAVIGVPPGMYRFVASMTGAADQSWTLVTATAKGGDALDLPFEIVAGDNVTGATATFSRLTQEVSGTLQNGMGLPAIDFTLIAFPTDRAYWRAGTRRTQTARPGTDGRFVIRSLPPGDYFIAALTDLNPSDIDDPSVLDLIVPGAVRFTLQPGEKKTQSFNVGGQQ